MLKLLDRYIIKKFLTSFFFVVLVILSVVVVIDLTEKNHKYLQAGLSVKEIYGYYLNFIPYIANMVAPLMLFIATVYVTAQLARHTEIVAILSGGVSFNRLLRPYMIGAAVVAIIAFWMNGWVIPNSNKKRIEFEEKYFEGQFVYEDRDVHVKVAPNTYLYFKSYNNNSDVANQITLERIEGNILKSKISARRMQWKSETENWQLKDWVKLEIENDKEIITKGAKLDTALNLTPRYFTRQHKLNEALTLDELDEYIDDLNERGADNTIIYKIERYIRYTYPFSFFILTFIGVVVASRKTRGGAGFQIALGFTLAFIFILCFTFTRSLAEQKTMDPLLAVWIPNIIFLGIGLYLYRIAPK